MTAEPFENLIAQMEKIQMVSKAGRITEVDGSKILASGLTDHARLGDAVEIIKSQTERVGGEVVQMGDSTITIMPNDRASGLAIGARVLLRPPLTIAPANEWLGRIVSADGQPLDGKPLVRGLLDKPLRDDPPPAALRRGFGERLSTGSYVMNTMLPLAKGQRIGLFAGSGIGKSSLLATLVQNVECDVVVVALVGERGRELRHFTQDVLGPEDMKKCVVVAATSDRPALERRRCAWTAMSVAEYFRDQGKSVLYVADSITRFAEAHRGIASAAGELPVLKGFPPSTAHLITELCERAGPGIQGSGDITAVLSVLVPGSDMDEPISDILRGVLDGHIVLDREIAERGRYPAINLIKSVSRSLPDAASTEENEVIGTVRKLLSKYEQNALMVRSGLYSEGSDPELDLAVRMWPELDAFVGICGPETPENVFNKLRLLLRRGGVR